MKKAVLSVLILMLALLPAAFAQEEEIVEADGLRYSLGDGGAVLTVWLEANPTTGYEWAFEISDESLLELITQEYVQDENPGEMAGVGGTWAASFTSPMSGKGGDVTLKLTYCRSWAPDPQTDTVREIALWAVENGTFEVREVK